MDYELFIHSLLPKIKANMNLILIFCYLATELSETYYFLLDLVHLQNVFCYEMGNSYRQPLATRCMPYGIMAKS